MFERVCWVKTSEELFFAIYMKHKEEMCIFGTCTAPEGDLSLGKNNPFVLTEWGFSSSDYPLKRRCRRFLLTRKKLDEARQIGLDWMAIAKDREKKLDEALDMQYKLQLALESENCNHPFLEQLNKQGEAHDK